jgi:hypothetical protein
MAANFEGNAGNEGNEGNAGNAGNETSVSGGWFFADRIDLPFVTELDSDNAPIKNQRILIGQFPPRNWAADWHAWVALTQFVTNLGTVPPQQARLANHKPATALARVPRKSEFCASSASYPARTR